MKAFKLFLLFVGIVALLVGGISVAVASVTSPIRFEEGEILVSVHMGSASIMGVGSSEWETFKGQRVVFEGDTLRSHTDSLVNINFYDQAEVRLDTDTEVLISQTLWEADNPDVFQANIFVETGRIWSRVLSFLSSDSSFEVETHDTVATVRGTIFSVWVDPGDHSGVYVDDHKVWVGSGTMGEMVEGGNFMEVWGGRDGQTPRMVKGTINDNWQDWISKNRVQDKEFDAKIKKKMQSVLRAKRSTTMAERLRLAISSSDTREAMQERFQMRRDMWDRLGELEERPTQKGTVRRAIEERVENRISPSAPEEGNENIGEMIQIDPPTLILNAGPAGGSSPVSPDTELFGGAPDTHEPAPSAADEIPPREPVSLTIDVEQTTLYPDQRVGLYAHVIHYDGSRMLVNHDVTWHVVSGGEVGSMEGNYFVAYAPGTAQVQAVFEDGVHRFVAHVQITVAEQAAVVPIDASRHLIAPESEFRVIVPDLGITY